MTDSNTPPSRYITVRRTALVAAGFVCVMLGTCLSCGCMMDSSKLAGFSQPKLQMSVDARRGKFDMEAGTDFEGKAKGHYNPETKEINAEIEIGSSASPVVKAEGERAEALVELRKIEAQMLIKMHELVGDNIKAAGGIVSDVAKAAVKIKESDNRSPLESAVGSLVWTAIKVAAGLLALLVLWGLIKRTWNHVVRKPTNLPVRV